MLALVCATLLLAGEPPRVADRVELVDGTLVEGRVVYEDPAGFVVRSGSTDREIPRKDVKSSYYRADNQRAAIERWLALAPDDERKTLDLAQYCKRHDLLEEMRLCAWYVLVLDPASDEAHEYLDHARSKQGWMVREGGQRVECSKVMAGHALWNDAWKIETTHYAVRSNLPLPQVLEAAFDLESHYRAFMTLFGTELRLYEVTEPINANIHGDAKLFSRQAGGRGAYFNPETMTLEIDASKGVDVVELTHEATHALLHATAVATLTARGDIPAWLDEGLAEYMSAGFRGLPGRIDFSKDGLYRTHFVTHARARRPYDLSRVLNFESGDFATSERSDLKYAQAYTLVHYGLNSEGGQHRQGFLDFMRSAYRGQSSQSHFEKALGLDTARIEREWLAYVKVVAGI